MVKGKLVLKLLPKGRQGTEIAGEHVTRDAKGHGREEHDVRPVHKCKNIFIKFLKAGDGVDSQKE